MPIPTRAVTASPVREQGITRGPVIVTGGGPLCAGEHQRAARELAVALGAQVVEAVPGRRLAPDLLAASESPSVERGLPHAGGPVFSDLGADVIDSKALRLLQYTHAVYTLLGVVIG